MLNIWIGIVAFLGTAAIAFAFVGKSEGFMIAGSILVGSALLAEAMNNHPRQ